MLETMAKFISGVNMAYTRKTKLAEGVRQAQADNAARKLCIALGVLESQLPPRVSLAPLWDAKARDKATIRPEAPVIPTDSNRFRRTRQEIAESKALEAWQQLRRMGTASNFTIEI